MKLLHVVGARPNFPKLAPVHRAAAAVGLQQVVVHTGQHYDDRLSGAFLRELALPEPEHNLGVGSGTHAEQTARIMLAFEPVLRAERPDWVVVVGDVNSTLACSLVASKLREELGCRIAHVEAGLRSHDWRMPEEVNRVLTDRLSDLLLTPSRDAHPNLAAEGIAPERAVFVGNVMIDSLYARREVARALDVTARLGLTERAYAVVTLHRPSNVDDRDVLRSVLEALAEVAARMPVVLPLHPRTRANAERFGLGALLGRFRVMDPVAYTEMLSLVDRAAIVLTDSGGLQEETTALGVPCVTLREQTERPVTVTDGTNRMVPWPITRDGVLASVDEAMAMWETPGATSRRPEGWDGRAGERVVRALCEQGGRAAAPAGFIEAAAPAGVRAATGAC